MQSARRFKIVLVTAPDLKTARKLAKGALQVRLIACANIVPKIESHYRWQGRIETGDEVLMILKCTSARLAALEKFIIANHPYDTLEILAVSLEAGTKKYLGWLAECCG